MKAFRAARDISDRINWYTGINENSKIKTEEEFNKVFAIGLYEMTKFYFELINNQKWQIDDEYVPRAGASDFLSVVTDFAVLLSKVVKVPSKCAECGSDVSLRFNERFYLLTDFITCLFSLKNRKFQRSLSEWEEFVDTNLERRLSYQCKNKKCGHYHTIWLYDDSVAGWDRRD